MGEVVNKHCCGIRLVEVGINRNPLHLTGKGNVLSNHNRPLWTGGRGGKLSINIALVYSLLKLVLTETLSISLKKVMS